MYASTGIIDCRFQFTDLDCRKSLRSIHQLEGGREGGREGERESEGGREREGEREGGGGMELYCGVRGSFNHGDLSLHTYIVRLNGSGAMAAS